MRARSALRERLADPSGTANTVARLVNDYGRAYWKRYALAFSFMALGAGCTAATAYLIGTAIDQAYVSRNFFGIAVVAGLAVVIFALKGLANYGQAVTLARISNQIIAANQRRMFDKLLHQDMAFFADKHSSQFGARVS
ncbi:MAG: ABC transporter transmembrane domain-containing protein, partial [Rhodoplanes sp.]